MSRPDPTPCRITHDDGLVTDGTVLSWRRDGDAWRALVRYARTPPAGHAFPEFLGSAEAVAHLALTFEHWVDGEQLAPA